MTRYSSVSLPLPLIKKIRKKIKGAGFKSVSDYVTFILREVEGSIESKKSFSKKDQGKVIKKLESLGYLK